MFFTLAALSSSRWQLQQTVKPLKDNFGIFGRSVSLSKDESGRLIVGASWETVATAVQVGKIYVYNYNAETGEYEQKQELVPDNNDRVIFNNTGSTVRVSKDGMRIVAGAPYSTVDGFEQVGALCVWEYDKDIQLYVQKAIITPVDHATEDDAMQGFGRSLTITDDGNTIASAYYNKPGVAQFVDQQGAVFVTTRNGDSWPTPTKLTPSSKYAGKRLKFGADLQFVDATHLVVGVTLFDNFWDAGTCYYSKNKDGVWELEQEILPDDVVSGKYENYDFKSYGAPIGMPSQNTLGISADFKKGSPITGAFFLISKNGDKWETKNPQVIPFPEKTDLKGISYCDSNTFMTHASGVTSPYNSSETIEAVIIFRRNEQGEFKVTNEMLYPPKVVPDLLNFGSDITWSADCNTIAVGAFTKYPHKEGDPNSDKPSNESRVYIYRNVYTPEEHSIGKGAIAAITISACLIVLIIIGIVVWCSRTHKGCFKTASMYESKLMSEQQAP